MWTEEKINQYITDKIEESLYLDYKAAGSLINTEGKKNDISKDVSAFANSDGGTIIYGIKEYKSETKYLPEKIDPIDRSQFTKETLEQIINSRISPRIQGIVITPVTIGESKNNQVVYVVDIPKGNTAHQASDKKYYRRYNFESIPMEDWEIKDIINRQNKAIIDITFRPRFQKDFFEKFLLTTQIKMAFDIIATNKGNKTIKYCDCMIIGSESIAKTIIPEPKLVKDSKYFELYHTNEKEHKVTLESGEYVINIQRMPILPLTYLKIGEIEFFSDFFIKEHELRITVALDDNRITKKIKGKEIID